MEPAGAPICWGKQFGDEDDECKNCQFNQSCRPATINHHTLIGNAAMAARRQEATLPQPRYALPVYPQHPQQPSYTQARFGSPQQPMLPQPSGYLRTMQIPTAPQMPPQQQPQYPQAPTGYQPYAPTGWNTPIAYLPRPNPGRPDWWQYQGETTGTRLGKNVLLTALRAIFEELWRFFANWTWPTSLGTT